MRAFARLYPCITAWYKTVAQADWKNTAEVRKTFKDADFVGDKVVFNIAWNRYRLIAYIAYRVRTVYVKAILTHKEYDNE